MPQSRKYYRVDYQDILKGNSRPNRILSLLDSIKKGEDPLPSPEEITNMGNASLGISFTVAQNKDLIENVQDEPKEASSQTKIPDIEINQEEECRGYFIKNDQKLSDANSYLNNALAFIEIIKHSADRLKTCNERIAEEDRIIQDLLHEIRQPVKNAEDGFNLYKLLHQAERRRQDYKDLIEPLHLIAKYVNTHQGVFEGFIPILKLARQRVENQKDRVYMQKSTAIRLPVGDAYRELPRQEQEKIKATYEANKRKEKYSYTL